MFKSKLSTIVILVLTALTTVAFLCTPCIASGTDNHSKPIPRWLQGYDIRPEFVPVQGEKIGAIQRLQGRIVIIHQATDEAFFGKTGDPIFKKDLIATLADTVCRIQFSSKDTASLGADSILTIEDYLDARSENKKSAVLSMKAGRIFFYVLRLLGYRDIDFKVETPSSVAAVRGTKFGLHVYESRDSKTGDAVAFTNCYCADGLIEIDGRMVEPGELYQSATGEVEPAPASYLNQFHASLNLPAPAPPVVTATRRDRTTDDDENRAALAEQNAAHTENIQEVRHLNLVREEAEPAAQPLPGPDEPPAQEPPTGEPPMVPEEPAVQEPPTEPNEPPVNEPPMEPEEPPFEEPPMEPGEPPIQEPPAEPNEPPMDEPPMEPEEPPVNEPPMEPEEPPTGPEEPPTGPEEPPTGPEEPPDDDDNDWDDDDDDWDKDDDDADHDEDRDEDDDDHPGQGKGHQNHDDDHPGQGKGHDKFD